MSETLMPDASFTGDYVALGCVLCLALCLAGWLVCSLVGRAKQIEWMREQRARARAEREQSRCYGFPAIVRGPAGDGRGSDSREARA
jgi:hypothetical protein